MYDFESVGVAVHGRTGGTLRMTCPQCSQDRKMKHKNQKCLWVNVDEGRGFCHNCGWSFHLQDTDEIARRKREWENARIRKSRKPTVHYKRPSFDSNRTKLSQALLDWFVKTRHISEEVLVKMKIAEQKKFMPQLTKEVNCVCFNYFENGQLVNTKSRDGEKNFCMEKDAELIPYNIDAICDTPEVCIVEGEMDALSLMTIGRWDVVSVPAGANANLSWLDRFVESHFENKTCIRIVVDTDEKGLLLRDELIRRLGVERCRVVTYGAGCKDANEHLIAFGADSLRSAIEHAEEVPLEGIFTADDLSRELRILYDNGFGPGAETGMENLDKLLTFELGRLAIVTGIPGDGKSEFLDQIVLRLCLLHDWRIGFFSPENVPVVYHLRKLAEKLTGYRFHPSCGMNDGIYGQVTRYLSEHVCHIMPEKDDFTVDTILEKARQLVARKGIRILVIDPLNRLDYDTSDTEIRSISLMLNKLTRFAQVNRCLVFLVAHPRKMNRNPYTKQAPTVEMYDINGSADFFNKADFGLVVERDKNVGVTRIHIQKVKFKHLGGCGEADFVYDMVSGRYHPCELDSTPTDPGHQILDTKFMLGTWLPEEELFTHLSPE